MRRTSTLIAAVAALALALSPGLAEARLGSGGSFGSRGSMTWSAPPSTATAPYSGSVDAAQPDAEQSVAGLRRHAGLWLWLGRSPFMSGLLGGLLGAGLGGLLFGHGFWGGGMGVFGFFGFLLQIFLLVWLVRFLIRLFRGPSPVFAGGPDMFARRRPAGSRRDAGRRWRRAGRSRSPSGPATTRRSSNCCRPTRRPGPRTT